MPERLRYRMLTILTLFMLRKAETFGIVSDRTAGRWRPEPRCLGATAAYNLDIRAMDCARLLVNLKHRYFKFIVVVIF